MLDLLPPPPSLLSQLTTPLATRLSLPTLPYHIHEVLGAYLLYQSIQSILSPLLSRALFPRIYTSLNTRTRINWDVHVVSFAQSCLINVLALYVIFADRERAQMKTSVVERVYGYTGASGLVQGLACGYFIWDLVVSVRYFRIFGPGILAHAVTALMVFSFGFVSVLCLLNVLFFSLSVALFLLRCHEYRSSLVLTCRCVETVLQLLRADFYPLRAVQSVSQYPLVLRQAESHG